MYTSEQARRLAGISYRKMDYWVRQGLVKPTQAARGTGSARRWSPMEVVQLRVMGDLREAGVSLQKIRRAARWLRTALPKVSSPLTDLTLVTDGKRIFYLSPNPGKLVDVLAGGQIVLSILSMGDILREVGEELPKAKAAAPVQYDLPERVELGEDGYFVGYCPALRGCVGQGKTRKEAQANLKKAIASYLSVLEEVAEEEARVRRSHRRATRA